jgi:hypothetical protein
MELRYIEVKDWNNLGDGDIVLFKLPEQQITYQIIMCNGIYCNREIGCNSKIFDYLGLNAKDFVQNIVGYECDGLWPQVKSIDDLKKVIKALDDECIKKFEKPNTSKFKVGDKVRILPRKGKPEDYTGVYIDEMLQFVGKTATIKSIVSDSSIRLVDNCCTWDPKALELIDEKEESKTMDTSINMDKPETQFEAELNLFPTKKHYQLNFNY